MSPPDPHKRQRQVRRAAKLGRWSATAEMWVIAVPVIVFVVLCLGCGGYLLTR
jgi:hypothetical protein